MNEHPYSTSILIRLARWSRYVTLNWMDSKLFSFHIQQYSTHSFTGQSYQLRAGKWQQPFLYTQYFHKFLTSAMSILSSHLTDGHSSTVFRLSLIIMNTFIHQSMVYKRQRNYVQQTIKYKLS